jgi:hypothetical protein
MKVMESVLVTEEKAWFLIAWEVIVIETGNA